MADDDDVEYESEIVVIGPYTFDLTTISFMPLEKLLENQTKGVEISGQKVWCGSVVVSEYLLRHPEVVNEKCAIELGSGTGIVGMMCHRLGAAHVFFTDHDQRSIDHMTVDIRTNDITRGYIHTVDWFQDEHTERLLSSLRDKISASPEMPILVVAGDVLYKAVLLAPFMRTASRILQENVLGSQTYKSQLLLCHVPRAGVDHSDVISAATRAGLRVNTVQESEWKSGAVLEIIPAEDYDRAQLYMLEIDHI